MGETVIVFLYAIFSIFITLFFPKQITDGICYGRHRDRENIKSKKIYLSLIHISTWFGYYLLHKSVIFQIGNNHTLFYLTYLSLIHICSISDNCTPGTVIKLQITASCWIELFDHILICLTDCLLYTSRCV